MPDNLRIGVFAFGGVLTLIALLGGNFKLFGTEVSSSVSNPILRFVAFALGALLVALGIHGDFVDKAPVSSSPSTTGSLSVVMNPSSPTVSPPTPSPTPATVRPASQAAKACTTDQLLAESHPRFEKLIDYIHANLNRPLSLSDLSSQSGLSPNQVVGAFNRHFGCKPKQWIEQEQLKKRHQS
jgi:hypothetical protein